MSKRYFVVYSLTQAFIPKIYKTKTKITVMKRLQKNKQLIAQHFGDEAAANQFIKQITNNIQKRQQQQIKKKTNDIISNYNVKLLSNTIVTKQLYTKISIETQIGKKGQSKKQNLQQESEDILTKIMDEINRKQNNVNLQIIEKISQQTKNVSEIIKMEVPKVENKNDEEKIAKRMIEQLKRMQEKFKLKNQKLKKDKRENLHNQNRQDKIINGIKDQICFDKQIEKISQMLLHSQIRKEEQKIEQQKVKKLQISLQKQQLRNIKQYKEEKFVFVPYKKKQDQTQIYNENLTILKQQKIDQQLIKQDILVLKQQQKQSEIQQQNKKISQQQKICQQNIEQQKALQIDALQNLYLKQQFQNSNPINSQPNGLSIQDIYEHELSLNSLQFSSPSKHINLFLFQQLNLFIKPLNNLIHNSKIQMLIEVSMNRCHGLSIAKYTSKLDNHTIQIKQQILGVTNQPRAQIQAILKGLNYYKNSQLQALNIVLNYKNKDLGRFKNSIDKNIRKVVEQVKEVSSSFKNINYL